MSGVLARSKNIAKIQVSMLIFPARYDEARYTYKRVRIMRHV
jgi:hypothetical protein